MKPTLKTDKAIGTIAVHSGHLGIIAAEIAGVVHDLVQQSAVQTTTFAKLTEDVAGLGYSNSKIVDATLNAAQEVKEMRTSVDASLERAKSLELSVRQVEDGLLSMNNALQSVSGAAYEISKIALQTRLIAFNVSAEAARAGSAGATFGVIALAVKELADRVQSTSKIITNTIRTLSERVESLETTIEAGSKHGNSADRDSVIADAVKVFGKAFEQVEHQVASIQAATAESNDLCVGISSEVKQLSSDVTKASSSLTHADRRVDNLLSMSEELIGLTAESGAETEDTEFIRKVIDSATVLGQKIEQAISRDDCSLEDMFDTQYLPIPGTNPQQYTTRFCDLTDQLFPDIQESMLRKLPGIIFCVAIDRNGYIPTHNKQYSHKQRANDPAWNAANCRNRRIFDDRTGLSAARNKKPFLLQTYRRDMGGGKFVIMKDVSAPISILGKHWGGLRLGYLTES
jgi:methyl-accepting chemotaxis protein